MDLERWSIRNTWIWWFRLGPSLDGTWIKPTAKPLRMPWPTVSDAMSPHRSVVWMHSRPNKLMSYTRQHHIPFPNLEHGPEVTKNVWHCKGKVKEISHRVNMHRKHFQRLKKPLALLMEVIRKNNWYGLSPSATRLLPYRAVILCQMNANHFL